MFHFLNTMCPFSCCPLSFLPLLLRQASRKLIIYSHFFTSHSLLNPLLSSAPTLHQTTLAKWTSKVLWIRLLSVCPSLPPDSSFDCNDWMCNRILRLSMYSTELFLCPPTRCSLCQGMVSPLIELAKPKLSRDIWLNPPPHHPSHSPRPAASPGSIYFRPIIFISFPWWQH